MLTFSEFKILGLQLVRNLANREGKWQLGLIVASSS